MATTEYETCALCGQWVKIAGFTSEDGKKNFCCAGCQSLFQLLKDQGLEVPDSQTPSEIHDDSGR